jgi:hypothetical protein
LEAVVELLILKRRRALHLEKRKKKKNCLDDDRGRSESKEMTASPVRSLFMVQVQVKGADSPSLFWGLLGSRGPWQVGNIVSFIA